MDRRKTDRRLNDPQNGDMINLQDILDILMRRRMVVLTIMVLIMIPGIFYVMTKPHVYESTSIIMMEEPDYNLGELSKAMGVEGKIDESTIDTQKNLLSSPRLIEETLKQVTGQEKVSQTDIESFYGHLTVDPVGVSRVIKVSYKSKNPEETATFVNTHIRNFINYRLDIKKQQIDVINKWLNEQVAKLKEDSQKKGQAIQKFRGESGIILGPDAENLIYKQISDLSQQLVPVETQKIALQGKVSALSSNDTAASLPEIIDSPVISQLKGQLALANQELRATSAQYGAEHPLRRAAQKRASQINADIARETSNIRKSLETQLEAVTKQEELLNNRINELNQQADQMQDQSLTMEGLQGDLESNRKLLAAYTDKFEEIKTKMDLSNSDIRIISQAEVPLLPSGPGKVSTIGLLVMLAFFSGIAIALAFEFVDRGIETENDVKRVLNLRLLGTLPATKNPLGSVTGKNRSRYLEEIKRIYLALSARKGPQTILITSANAREGKTTFALSLAQYLASIKSRVILVDADTHTPSLSTLTGTEVSPGFAELMSGTADFTKTIKRDSENLPVIPAGDHDRYHTDILGTNAFPQMLETLKSQYDFIILDCANALTSTDAEVMAGQVDNVIMVAQWNKTPKKILKRVAENLRQHARDVPNVVLTKRA